MKTEDTRRLLLILATVFILSEFGDTVGADVPVLSLSEFNGTVTADVHQMNVQDNRSISSLVYVLAILSWRNIVVLYSVDSEDLLLKLFQGLENSRLNSTQCTVFREKWTHGTMKTIYKKYLYKDLNIIVLFSADKSNLGHSKFFDLIVRGTSDTILNTKSKWFLFSTSNTSLFNMHFEPVITNLTNIAHVFPNSSEGRSPIVRTLINGHFQPVTGNLSSEKIFPKIRYKLNAKTVTIGIACDDVMYNKSLTDILDIASAHLNFTYKLVAPVDGEFGGKYSNGKWSGLVGQLVEHEVDLVLGVLAMTQDRREAIDFILPQIVMTKPGVLYKKEKLIHNSWFLFWRPFQNIVYGYILVSYIIFSLLLLCISKDEIHEPLFQRVSTTFLVVLGYLFLEGNNIGYKRLHVRVLLASWLLFCVVLGAIYAGNLTRSLIPRELKPFNTVQELINKPGWKIGIVGGSASVNMFNSSQNGDIKLFWTRILERSKDDPSVMSSSGQFHMDRVLQGKYAFVSRDLERFMKHRNDCLLDINENIFDLPSVRYSMAVPKGSSLKWDLDGLMSKLDTSGLLEYIMEPKDNRPVACRIVDDTVKPLYIDNMKGAFAVLAIGVGFAGLFLLVEILVKAYISGGIKETF